MIKICERDDTSKEYVFEDLYKLSLFLERRYSSVYDSIYKMKIGYNKTFHIKNYDGLYYIVLSCPDEDIFRYKMGCRYEMYNGDNLILVTNCVKDLGETVKEVFSNMDKFEQTELKIKLKKISK